MCLVNQECVLLLTDSFYVCGEASGLASQNGGLRKPLKSGLALRKASYTQNTSGALFLSISTYCRVVCHCYFLNEVRGEGMGHVIMQSLLSYFSIQLETSIFMSNSIVNETIVSSIEQLIGEAITRPSHPGIVLNGTTGGYFTYNSNVNKILLAFVSGIFWVVCSGYNRRKR